MASVLAVHLQSNFGSLVVTVFGWAKALLVVMEHIDTCGRCFLLESMFMAFTVHPLPSDDGETLGLVPGPGDSGTTMWLFLEDVALAIREVSDATTRRWGQ
ncbi:hypothetical protein QYE76_047806 [Lolium multiflorum]|uniref:Uncharacterized protein n=1 Tax=Lolium multiflorum TaxID=4521 RepID=A0AAD8X2B0_LOLMU|nr:hypothetical protein QYE76_047806 [Lolium multiflorum]